MLSEGIFKLLWKLILSQAYLLTIVSMDLQESRILFNYSYLFQKAQIILGLLSNTLKPTYYHKNDVLAV